MPYARQSVLVVTREFGLPNQPWLFRQVSAMTSLSLQILCWKNFHAAGSDTPNIPIIEVATNATPFLGGMRWLYRLASLRGGNFYAAPGKEHAVLKKLIREANPSAILCYFGEMALRLIDVAQELRIPLIAYFHGDFLFVSDRWHRWSLLRRLDKFAAIVVVTAKERDWLLEQGVKSESIHVIPCGAPTALSFLKRQGNPKVVRFAMASRLVEEKGCSQSIRAFARVASQIGSVSLDIFGDGPERQNLEALVNSLGLKNAVTFHGYVNAHYLAAELAGCDVFIQHSLRKEGSPVSIVEAMLCGLPVVATPVGGIVDQVIDSVTGLIIAEHDFIGMSSAMAKLAGNPALRIELGANGRNRAIKAFDSAKLARSLEQVVVKVCNESSRQAAHDRI
jgi:glycosyltransferase involved in cell wall biosynthesis